MIGSAGGKLGVVKRDAAMEGLPPFTFKLFLSLDICDKYEAHHEIRFLEMQVESSWTISLSLVMTLSVHVGTSEVHLTIT